ncbi:MFS transporter [Nocardia camponoti]|uniref:Major facilitator family transporter n=1 Tax=Nocardia camponoti TaxID=1616106 RepID=A0A917VDE4_9NOCA|nr:MFS transporter [Nocardia camponoti]GGK65364.1 major facilitator family transporter [Nocardia camponoti]
MTVLAERKPAALGGRVKSWQAVCAAMVAIAWGGNEFTPLLVMYKANGLPLTAVDLLLFYYVLGIVPAMLIGGPLSDRFGRRKLMLPAPLIAAAGSLLLAMGADSVLVLALGRMLSGAALGLAMAVGGSWLKELSQAPYDTSAPGTGAKRSAMSLTAGFALGAVAAGLLAQWGPLPNSSAYLLNAALCVAAGCWLLRTPETVTKKARGSFLADLRIPAAGHRRFLRVAVPVALWLFTANATAYAVLPTLLLPRVHAAPIAFSALVCMVTLGCGFTIQSFARRIDRPGTARLALIALVLLTTGMVLAACTATTLSIPVTLVTAVILGSGYGIGLVAGLQQIERIAAPTELAGLNAVFYSVSYLGFGVPAVLSALHGHLGWSYATMYLVTAGLAAACLSLVAANYRERL